MKQYAGTTEGLVAGVGQVNVTIPAGVASGIAVPLVVLQAGINSSSPGVTIAIQ